jgi:hypothetical protein
MLDSDRVDGLLVLLRDRFTPEELCEILGLSVDDLFNSFIDDVLKTNWDQHL